MTHCDDDGTQPTQRRDRTLVNGIGVVLLGVVVAHLTGCAGPAGKQVTTPSDELDEAPSQEADPVSASADEARVARADLLLAAPVPVPGEVDPRKRALIVAIGEYEDPELAPIAALNDVPLVQDILARHGFPENQVLVLTNENASREGIEAAFEKHLIEEANPGDILYFHYSGHGQQVPDDSGEEPDGYDESIVAWDAEATFNDEYQGEGHIRDDVLGRWLDAAREKTGEKGQVVAVLDACNSGTSHRQAGQATVRGVNPAGPAAHVSAAHVSADSERGSSEPGSSEPGSSEPGSSAVDVTQRSGLAPLVMLAGARHDELNYETTLEDGTPVGSLSWALSRSLGRAGKGLTWDGLFAYIARDMSVRVPQQRPQLEGAGNAAVFDGMLLEQSPWLEVALQRGDQVQLAGGTLKNVFDGAGIAFYPVGTTSPDGEPLAVGTVELARPLASVVRLDEAAEVEDTWAFVVEPAFPEMNIGVELPDDAGELRAALSEVPIVNLATAGARLRVRPASGSGEGWILETVPAEKELARSSDEAEIVAAVMQWSRSRYLAELELDDPRLEVALRFRPVRWQGATETNCGTPVPREESEVYVNGEWQLTPGDGYTLTIENHGRQEVYATVLSVAEDGSVAVLYPHPDTTIAWDPIPPGVEHTIESLCYEAAPPYGREMLKLIALPEKVDLRPVIAAQGESKAVQRGDAHPLQALVMDTYSGSRATARRIAGGTTDSVLLRIVE